MVIDSSRFGNAPETLSKTPVSGSRSSVLPSDLNAAPTSASGVRTNVPMTWLLLRVDDRHAALPAIVGALALRQRTRIVVGLQRQELRDEDLACRRR